MKAKKYFDKEYGNNHVNDVVNLKDLESLYGLMQEYADEKLRLHCVSHSIAKEYAEFCVRCDREGLPLLELEDYIKQYCR